MAKNDKKEEILQETLEVNKEGLNGKGEETEKKKTPNYSDAELDKMAIESAKNIKKETLVKIRIPKDQLNKNDEVVPVVINGYFWSIKRGETVEVPSVVAEVLEQAELI